MNPEEAVIGACLLDPNVIRLAAEHVMPSDFQSWQGEQAFDVMIRMQAAGEPIDVITVAARLADIGSRLTALDLHRIISEVPSASSVSFYALQVRENAVRRALRLEAAKLAQGAEDESVEPGMTLASALDALTSIRDDAPLSRLGSRALSEVMAEADSYDWIIAGLLERQDRLMITGAEGAGKSTLIRQLAIFSAAGIHPFWLREIPPVNVTIVDRENSERQWRRQARRMFNQARTNGTADPGRLTLSCDPKPMDITKDRDLGKIHKLLDDNPTDILFIGPLYRLVPRAINNDDDAAPVLAALDSLRSRNVALVIEAHAGHGKSGDRDLRPVGSSAFLRWPEFGRGIRPDPNVEGGFFFEQWRGDRERRQFPAALSTRGPVPWSPPTGIPPELEAQFRNTYNQSSFMDRTAGK